MDFQAFLKWFHENDPLSTRIGAEITEIGAGYAKGRLAVREDNRNLMGGLHGGAMATFADILAGCAVVHHSRSCVTLDASIRYLKGVWSGVVLGESRELHSGAHTAVSEVELRDEAGALCCVCTATMYLLDKPLRFG